MPAITAEQVHQLFGRAFNARDIDALMELYEPDAVLVAQPGQVATGTEQIREALSGFLAPNGPIAMTYHGAVHGASVSVVVGRWSLSGTGPDSQPVTIGGVASDIVRRDGEGVWRFATDKLFSDALTSG